MLSARTMRPSCPVRLLPSTTEGAGNAGCPVHPQPRVQMEEAHERSHHRYAATSRHSLRNGFNGLLRALPGVRDFLVTVIGAMPKHRRQFGASQGAPGPHDFAVRAQHRSSVDVRRPSHPAPNTRDDREAPLFSGTGRRGLIEMICPTGIAKYFCERDWTTQIRLNRLTKFVFARTIFELSRLRCDRQDQPESLAPEHHVRLKELQPREVAPVRLAPIIK
jgi:hypothetical protein